MKLSKSEEALMGYLWRLERAFMKDLLQCYPIPKPAKTTVATLLKRLANKGVISYTLVNNTRQYYPLVSKDAYFSNHLTHLIGRFFDGSSAQFASFFTQKADLTKAELESLQAIIQQQIKEREK